MKVEKKIPRIYFTASITLDNSSKEVNEDNLIKMLDALGEKVDKEVIREMINVWDALCPVGIW